MSVWSIIYRYLTKVDIVIILLGSIGSIAFGSIISFVQLIDGNMINTYSSVNGNSEMLELFLMSVYLALGSFGVGWLMFTCWLKIGNKLGRIIR